MRARARVDAALRGFYGSADPTELDEILHCRSEDHSSSHSFQPTPFRSSASSFMALNILTLPTCRFNISAAIPVVIVYFRSRDSIAANARRNIHVIAYISIMSSIYVL